MTVSITLYGFQSKIGTTVSVNIAGLNCGDYVVQSDGSISVPYGSDPDGYLAADYLYDYSQNPPTQGWVNGCSIWVAPVQLSDVLTLITVPISVGYRYITQGQRVRPNTAAQAKTQQGDALGVLRRANQFAALVVQGVNDDLAFGTDFSRLRAVELYQPDQVTPLDHATVFAGVYHASLDDGSSFDGMLAWQTSAPQPCVLAAVTTFLETEER